MTILQHSDELLVVQAGTRILNETTLILNRSQGVARVERATFMIPRKAEEVPLSEIAGVELMTQKDSASGAERYLPVIRLGSGRVLSLPPLDDKREAEETTRRVRDFVGLRH